MLALFLIKYDLWDVLRQILKIIGVEIYTKIFLGPVRIVENGFSEVTFKG